MNWKEVAKFISGAAAIEVINHTVLATSSILPLHFFSLTISRTTNIIILFSWIVVLTGTIYYGWVKND